MRETESKYPRGGELEESVEIDTTRKHRGQMTKKISCNVMIVKRLTRDMSKKLIRNENTELAIEG